MEQRAEVVVELDEVCVSLVDEPGLPWAFQALDAESVLDVVTDIGFAKLFELNSKAGPSVDLLFTLD